MPICVRDLSTDYCKSRVFGRGSRPVKLASCKTLGIIASKAPSKPPDCKPASWAGTVHSADSGQCIGSMRHLCLVAAWVAALQLCTPVAALQQSTRVPAVDHSRRQFFAQAAASSLVAAALPQTARAANETQPEFDAAAYFGIFSCEGWGQKRMPGSNTCVPK